MEHNIGAWIITYTILGAPCYKYSIMGPKPCSNNQGPCTRSGTPGPLPTEVPYIRALYTRRRHLDAPKDLNTLGTIRWYYNQLFRPKDELNPCRSSSISSSSSGSSSISGSRGRRIRRRGSGAPLHLPWVLVSWRSCYELRDTWTCPGWSS